MTTNLLPTLELPDPTRPFTQPVEEKDGCMTLVLLQNLGGELQSVAYFSGKLDPVSAGLPCCLHAVAAVLALRDIVGDSDLTLLVPHAYDTTESGPLPCHYFAKSVELLALTSECRLAER